MDVPAALRAGVPRDASAASDGPGDRARTPHVVARISTLLAALAAGCVARPEPLWERSDLAIFPGSAAFTPEGDQVVACGEDGRVHFVDARDGVTRRALGVAQGRVDWAVLSPDGSRVVGSTAEGSFLLDPASDSSPISLRDREGRAIRTDRVAFSGDGTRFATEEWGVVRVHDTMTGRTIASLEGSLHARTADLFLDHDGSRLLTCSRAPDAGSAAPRIHDVATGRELAAFDPGADAVLLSPDGRSIAAAHHGGLPVFTDGGFMSRSEEGSWFRIRRLQDGRHLAWENRWWTPLAFSPDGTRLLTCSGDPNAWSGEPHNPGHPFLDPGHPFLDWVYPYRPPPPPPPVHLWFRDVESAQVLVRFERHETTAAAASFSRDGKRLLVVWADDAWILDGETGSPLALLEAEAPPRSGQRHGGLSPDRRLAVTCHGILRAWPVP